MQGQICDILRPSYESLPAPLATQIPSLWIHISGERGRGGALILDRCRAFDLLASVDAHLWERGWGCERYGPLLKVVATDLVWLTEYLTPN